MAACAHTMEAVSFAQMLNAGEEEFAQNSGAAKRFGWYGWKRAYGVV
jgi:hypothetical protein